MAKAAKDDAFDAGNSAEDDSVMFENSGEGLSVDLSAVEEMKFEALPKAIFNGVIEDLEFQFSKSSNKPMWNMKIAVTDEGEFQNRKQFTILSFSEGALPGTKTALATFAPELLSGPFNPKDPDVIAAQIGKRVKFKIKHETYNDETQSRIGKWLVPEGGEDGFIG